MTKHKSCPGNKSSIIVFFLILLSLLTIPVSASMDEEIMAIRASANIAIHERIGYQDYTVKVHEFHNDMVSLAVYKDSKFIELFNFYEDESRMYDDIQVEVIRIEGSKALIAISTPEIRTVWSQLKPAHAFWGDYIQRNEYGTQVLSFNQDAVELAVYEGDNKLGEYVYYTGTAQEYLNDFKILVTNVDNTGYVDMSFFKRLPLYIKGSIDTEKYVYIPDENIKCRVEIINRANIRINLADVELTTEPAMEIKSSASTVNGISQNQSHIFEFVLAPSVENDNQNLKIRAQVTLVDYIRKKYYFTFEKNLYISSNIGIIKEVIPSELDLEDDSGKNSTAAMVWLSIFNVGTSSKDIMISDFVPDGIWLHNSSVLEWNRHILPDEVINITYYITTDMPGEYMLPATEISYADTTIQSTGVPFIVHGPEIIIRKTAHTTGDTVHVTNYIENIGDRAAYVIATDNYPQNCTVLEGDDNWDDIMQPGESGEFNYTITYPDGLNRLPGASIQYQDITGNTWYYESDHVEIISNAGIPEVGKYDLIVFLLSSFFVVLGLVVSIVALIGAVIFNYSGRYSKKEYWGKNNNV